MNNEHERQQEITVKEILEFYKFYWKVMEKYGINGIK